MRWLMSQLQSDFDRTVFYRSPMINGDAYNNVNMHVDDFKSALPPLTGRIKRNFLSSPPQGSPESSSYVSPPTYI